MAKEGWPLSTGVTQHSERVSELPQAFRMGMLMHAQTSLHSLLTVFFFIKVSIAYAPFKLN